MVITFSDAFYASTLRISKVARLQNLILAVEQYLMFHAKSII